MEKFFNQLIGGFSGFFSVNYDTDIYPNQTYDSIRFIYDKCMEINPDAVIDIGTNFGASTIAAAKALHDLKKNLDIMTTIDLDHDHWKNKTPIIQKHLLDGMNISDIKTITSDFKLITPEIDEKKKYFVFYDIHDTNEYSFVEKFLNEWVPKFNNSIIAFHDVSVVPNDFVLLQSSEQYPMAKIEYNDIWYAGYSECEKIVQWAKNNKISLNNVPETSIVWINQSF